MGSQHCSLSQQQMLIYGMGATGDKGFWASTRCRLALQALQQLFCARRILGNSYVSAFYFFGNDMFSDEITPEQNDINKSLFEDQQACLETEVSWSLPHSRQCL